MIFALACRAGFHTARCRGRVDHWPISGWWRTGRRWTKYCDGRAVT